MAHYKIFISYSSEDQDIIDFIESELSNHDQFQPLIIARNRETLKPLTEKVMRGLIEAEIVVPVLTKKSINTQWINQEIGYATAIKKKISPIVEKEIIKQLRGFIHNQVDIPYNYISSTENIDGFKEAFKTLIQDLEAEYSLKQKNNEKSGFLKGLAKIDELNKKKEFEQKKQNLIESENGFINFEDEITKIENEFGKKITLLKDRSIYLSFASDKNPISFSIGKAGYVSKVEIHQPYINTTVGSFLSLARYKGNIDVNGQYNNYEFIAEIRYQFYYDNDLKPIWKRTIGKEEISSEEIVESCFSWLLERFIAKTKSL